MAYWKCLVSISAFSDMISMDVFSKIVPDNAYFSQKKFPGSGKTKISLKRFKFLHRCLNSNNRKVKGLHINMKFKQLKMKPSLVNGVSIERNRVTR